MTFPAAAAPALPLGPASGSLLPYPAAPPGLFDGMDQVASQPFRIPGDPAGTEARRLIEEGLARRVIADVLVARDAPDSQQVRAAAAGLLVPAPSPAQQVWVIGFASAVWLHAGVPEGPGPVARRLQVIIPPGRRRPRASCLHGRQVVLPLAQVTFIGPVAITDPVRTAADVARDLPAGEALEALRRLGEFNDVRPGQVLDVLAMMRYARGAALARAVVNRWAQER